LYRKSIVIVFRVINKKKRILTYWNFLSEYKDWFKNSVSKLIVGNTTDKNNGASILLNDARRIDIYAEKSLMK